jgi:hypothetical protein
VRLPYIAMAIDASTIVPASVQRNLADKLYEKRKNAALEVLDLYFCNIFLVRFYS